MITKSIQKERVFYSQKDGHPLDLVPHGSWDMKMMFGFPRQRQDGDCFHMLLHVAAGNKGKMLKRALKFQDNGKH